MNGASLKHLDWDAIYREGTPPWETGMVEPELIRAVESGEVPRGTALEIGCGTGADAIYLVKQGFEVTAVDSSATAIERARVRAEQEDALPRFVLADIFEFAPTAGQFDFVYDKGFYHFIRQFDLNRYLDVLWRTTRPGSYYLTVAGAPAESCDNGPPQVTERQIYNELGRLFEVIRLEACRLGSSFSAEGFPAWCCLMRRPVIGK
jgi:SAM-dependent methyltransferase